MYHRRDISEEMPSTLSIVYVNANVKTFSTPLEKMLHDLMCAKSEDMLTPEFAARMKQIKHPEGKEMSNMHEMLRELMGDELQRGIEQGREEGRKEERESTVRRAVKSLLKQGVPFPYIEETFREDLPKEELLALQRDTQKELSKCR